MSRQLVETVISTLGETESWRSLFLGTQQGHSGILYFEAQNHKTDLDTLSDYLEVTLEFK